MFIQTKKINICNNQNKSDWSGQRLDTFTRMSRPISFKTSVLDHTWASWHFQVYCYMMLHQLFAAGGTSRADWCEDSPSDERIEASPVDVTMVSLKSVLELLALISRSTEVAFPTKTKKCNHLTCNLIYLYMWGQQTLCITTFSLLLYGSNTTSLYLQSSAI